MSSIDRRTLQTASGPATAPQQEGADCEAYTETLEETTTDDSGPKRPRAHEVVYDAREQAMIEAFIGGDMAGFKFVYAKYRQRIFSYCLYYMNSETLAEDAFQEVFSRAYTRREQLREAKALKSWLLLITRSVCLNMLRTSKFTPDFVPLTIQDSDGEMHERRELSVEPNEQMIADDMLKNALSKLAPMYRDAFLLREFEGYDYDEIAQMTGASVMNVKVRITRAKKRLRILLAPYYSRQATSSRGRNMTAKQNTDITTDSHEAEDRDSEEVYEL